MNWIDTSLLVYVSLRGHPAKETVERELTGGAWGSSVLVLLELYQVLTRHYAVAPGDAADVVRGLASSPIHWTPLDLPHVQVAITAREQHQLESGDVVLLQLARDDHDTLVTGDKRLIREAQAQGLAVRNPIAPALAREVARWEEQHRPSKGLSRVLHGVERWLRAEDPRLADRFIEATGNLTALPS